MEIGYLIKEIFVDRVRAILTLFAIAWGTLAISLMLAVGQGLLVSLNQFLGAMGSHFVVMTPGVSSKPSQGSPAGTAVYFTAADIEALKHLPLVQFLSVEYSMNDALVRGSDSIENFISGVDANYLSLHPVKLGTGRFINEADIAHSRNVIVLGDQTAQSLFNKADPLGQYVNLGPFTLQVIGVSASNPGQYNFYEASDDYLAWLPVSTFKAFHPSHSPQYLLIKTTSPQTEAIRQTLLTRIANLHHLDPADQSIVEFPSNKAVLKTIHDFFIGLQWFLGTLGAITLLIASFGIANMMYLNVKRATPIIGLQMALGAQPWEIAKNYLIEAMFFSLAGGLTGLLLTLLFLSIANLVLAQLSLLGPVSVHLELSLPLVLMIIFILGLTGLSAGIFPSLRAARIQPSEALRYE